MGQIIYNHTLIFNNTYGTLIYNHSKLSGWNDFGANVALVTDGDSVGIGTTAPNAKLEINGTGQYIFNVSNGTKPGLLVNASGGVGIGTATPSSTFHLKHVSTASTYSTETESTGADNYNRFTSTSGSGEYGIYADALYFQPLDTLANGIRFFGSSANRPDLRILANGDIGVGTNSPGAKFEINGTRLYVFNASNGSISGLTVRSNGQVGIGDPNPTQKLDVRGHGNFSGDLYVQNNSLVNQWLYNQTTAFNTSMGMLIYNHTREYNNTMGQIIYNHTLIFNNTMGVVIYNYSNVISGSKFTSNTTSFFNSTVFQVGLGTITPYYLLDVNGSANISGSLFVGGKLVNQFLYNQSSVTDITQWLYNETTAFNTSMGTVIYNHTTTANKSITDAYGKFFYNQSSPYDTFNYNQTLGAITKVIGTIDFNGGWTSNGLTIQGGNLYAQTLFVYNISSLGVNNLEVNGSLIPNPGFNNTFDVGNSSSQWKNGWF